MENFPFEKTKEHMQTTLAGTQSYTLKKDSEIYFQVIEIKIPEGMRFDEYNEYEREDAYLYAKAKVFVPHTNEKTLLERTPKIENADPFHYFNYVETVMLTLHTTILIKPYLMWKGKVKSVEAAKSRNGYRGPSYKNVTIGSITGWHILAPDEKVHYNDKLYGCIGNLVRNHSVYLQSKEGSIISFYDPTDITESLLENVEKFKKKHESQESDYFDLLRLSTYQHGLRYWNLKLEQGYSIETLNSYGEQLTRDPIGFALKFPRKRMITTERIEILRENPFGWTLEQCTSLVVITQITGKLQDARRKQKMCLDQNQLLGSVKSEVSNMKPIKSDIIRSDGTRLGGFSPILAKDMVVDLFQKMLKTILYLDKDNDRVYLLEHWEREELIKYGLQKMKKRLQLRKKYEPFNFELVGDKDPKKWTPQEKFVNEVLTNYNSPFHVLNGAAGTGKTTTIKMLTEQLLKRENNNVLLTSFMGRTVSNLLERVVEPIEKQQEAAKENKPFKSFVECVNIHTFKNRSVYATSYREFSAEDTIEEYEKGNIHANFYKEDSRRRPRDNPNTIIEEDGTVLRKPLSFKKPRVRSFDDEDASDDGEEFDDDQMDVDEEFMKKKGKKKASPDDKKKKTAPVIQPTDQVLYIGTQKYDEELFRNITHIIVDEVGVIELILFSRLFEKLPDFRLIKIILVGDFDQILSIGPGNLMYDFMIAATKSGVLTRLETNYRFFNKSPEEVSSLFKNLSLVYQRTKKFVDEFVTDEATSLDIISPVCDKFSTSFKQSRAPSALGKIEEIYRTHGSTNVQVITHLNDTRREIMKQVRNSPNYGELFCGSSQQQVTTEGSSKNPDFKLPVITNESYFTPGSKIMFTKNNRSFRKNLFRVRAESIDKYTNHCTKEFKTLYSLINLKLEGEARKAYKNPYTKKNSFEMLMKKSKSTSIEERMNAKHMETLQKVATSDYKVRPLVAEAHFEETFYTPYISNGQIETVESVEIGFEIKSSGAIANYYYIYRMVGWSKDSVVVVGADGAVNPRSIEFGIVTTVCKMQGCEKDVVVFVLTKRELQFMDYRTFLVAISRARNKLYILIEHIMKPLTTAMTDIVLRDSEPRYSCFHEKLCNEVCDWEPMNTNTAPPMTGIPSLETILHGRLSLEGQYKGKVKQTKKSKKRYNRGGNDLIEQARNRRNINGNDDAMDEEGEEEEEGDVEDDDFE